ncbi:MAG: ice-binding family protein, partial [Parcubacteria group bacterium]
TITNTGASVITGDLGLHPGTSVTGFPPGTLNGNQHVANAVAAQAQIDLTAAYVNAAGQTPITTVPTELGGTTLTPGSYDSAAGDFQITGTLTLDGQGNAGAVFIFKTASTLVTASNSNIVLINGAQACNVFWQVGSSATLGTDSTFRGNILALTSATLTTGADVDGRVLARNGAVTLDTNGITRSICAGAEPSVPVPAPDEPLPTDSDGDGVADTVDTDDDNDGIPDAEEAGVTATPGLPEAGIAPKQSRNGVQSTIGLLVLASAVTATAVAVRKKSSVEL